MEGSLKIFRIFGIDIKIHFSWWIVFFLLSWSLSTAFFPQFFPGYLVKTYWLMGVVSALLLFVSVLLHELSHSLVAKAKNIKVESITLFFFGGVAGITKEDLKPSSEFMMAIAGPLFSLLLSGLFFVVYKFNGNVIWTGITFYLYQINLMLALFNLVPGFPLDGGRALRAILYAYFKDLKKATYIAAMGGKFFGGFLFFLGMISLISGVGNALWFIFLGGFLYFLAGMSYQQVVIKETLSKIPLKQLITAVVSVSPELNFSDLIKKYTNSGEEVFLVGDDKFSGILDTRKIDKMQIQMQNMLKLKQLSVPLSKIKGLKINDNAYTAFSKFSENGVNILPVYEKDKLLGFVTRDIIMHRLIWDLKFSGLKERKK